MRSLPSSLPMMLLAACLITACGSAATETPAESEAGLPNPASVFCEAQGGRLEIREDAAGNQAGYCIFSNGSECDEWAYFRGECQPGGQTTQAPAPTSAPVVAPVAEPPEGWDVYTHPTLGFSFFYPADCTLVSTDTARYTAVVGPLVDGENWPWFTINHPDEPDFHPPADVDLQAWLAEASRLPGKVVGTRMIAGETAVHTRFDDPRGPQAYPDDRYYFVHGGQLYEIVIMHTGKEDWGVYDTFLDSYAFQD